MERAGYQLTFGVFPANFHENVAKWRWVEVWQSRPPNRRFPRHRRIAAGNGNTSGNW
jgi:hypothetical protein